MAIVDNNVTEIITKDKSLVPILFFGRIENIAIAADAPQIATDPALKRPKSLFLRRTSEKIQPNKIVIKIRMKIKNKDAPPSCVMFSRLNLKPKKLTPNFKTGSEASQIPFSKDFLFDR